MYLRCAVATSPTKWFSWLALAKYWYNTCYHTAVGCTPFKASYGTGPHYSMVSSLSTSRFSEVDDVVHEHQFFSDLLQQQLHKTQLRMKQTTDKKCSFRDFQVGDKVLLKLQPYAQHSVVNRPYPKLAFKYFGPYNILEKIGLVAYRLELPYNSQVHPVFHISQLKPFSADYSAVFSTLPSPAALDVFELFWRTFSTTAW